MTARLLGKKRRPYRLRSGSVGSCKLLPRKRLARLPNRSPERERVGLLDLFTPSEGGVSLTRRTVLAVVAAALGLAQTRAQESTRPQFDVASVKPNLTLASDRNRSSIRPGPGSVSAKRASFKSLVMWAYGVKAYQVVSSVNWLDSQWYDIEAKADEKTSKDHLMLMMQTLLADRFHLVQHRETRELAVNALSVDKADKNGPKLHEAPPGDKVGGQVRFAMAGKAKQLIGTQAPISELIVWLNSLLIDSGRPVIDRTGLTGAYDFQLEWLPDDDFPPTPLSAALQQQLGLKLEAIKAPVEMLVIDRAEKVPSGN